MILTSVYPEFKIRRGVELVYPMRKNARLNICAVKFALCPWFDETLKCSITNVYLIFSPFSTLLLPFHDL